MLGEGVKWFDFLCPFSLKFAALAQLGPSARTSPLARITLNSNSYLGTYPFLPCSSLKVIGQLGSSICELDLSFCQLDLNLGPLEQLCGLQTLIMDNCKLTDRHCLPYLKHLQTLR